MQSSKSRASTSSATRPFFQLFQLSRLFFYKNCVVFASLFWHRDFIPSETGSYLNSHPFVIIQFYSPGFLLSSVCKDISREIEDSNLSLLRPIEVFFFSGEEFNIPPPRFHFYCFSGSSFPINSTKFMAGVRQ